MDSINASLTDSSHKPGMSKLKWAVVVIIIVIALGAIVWFALASKNLGKVLGANISYQAVFLTNGQVYFGKLSEQPNWIVLTDIYYLQATQPLQQTASSDTAATPPTQPNIQLIKLGSELHGPQDQMNIERDKVLFWENMKDDSKVVQAIHQYKSK